MSATGAFATIILERVLDMRDGARAARVLRVRLRPRADTRPNPMAFDAVKWAGGDGGGRRRSARSVVLFVLAGDPARLGATLHAARAGAAVDARRRCSRGSPRSSRPGLGAIRRPGRLLRRARAVVSALAVDRARHLGGRDGVPPRRAVHRLVPADGAARRRRGGADAGRRRRLSRGVPVRRDDVLRRAGRRRGRRGDRAARCSRSVPSLLLGLLFAAQAG